MDAAADEIEAFDFAVKVGMAKEGGKFVVGTVAVKGTLIGGSSAFDEFGGEAVFEFDQRLDFFAEHAGKLVEDVFAGLDDEAFPILALVSGYVDHDEPVFFALGGIFCFAFAADVYVDGRIFVDAFFFPDVAKLFLVILTEKDVVQIQFGETFLYSPVKNQS